MVLSAPKPRRSVSLRGIRVAIFSVISVALLAITILPPYLLASLHREVLAGGIGSMVADVVDVSTRHSEAVQAQLIRQKAQDVAGQIAVFFARSTLIDWQVLRNIAVQPIGDKGYTALFECQTGVTIFHKDRALEGQDLHYLREAFPDWWQIYHRKDDCTPASGFYRWQDVDGMVRRKFMAVAPVRGTPYMLAATTYVDEFSKSKTLITQAGTSTLHRMQGFLERSIQGLIGKTVLIVLLIVLGLFLVMLFVTKKFSQFIYGVQHFAAEIGSGNGNAQAITASRIVEFDGIASSLNVMRQALAQSQKVLIENAQQQAVLHVVAQVAHDIRSPLTALQVATGQLAEVPEARRVMLRNAVRRITDIINDLATRRAGPAAALAPGTEATDHVARAAAEAGEVPVIVLLSSLVDTLLSEKRIQCRAQLGVRIEGELTPATYGCFVQVDPAALQRVLSNLINNAVEALRGEGLVTVTMVPVGGRVEIRVQDTGPGIPPEVLSQLMQRGATFGKKGGSGLGLYHARTSVEAWGGTLRLASVVGQGTTAIVQLPVAAPPIWFVPQIALPTDGPVIIVDDDSSIHQVWDGRLAALGPAAAAVPVQHFSSGTAVLAAAPFPAEAVWLCDYELLGEPSNGLDLIDRLGVASRAILVTSRYEDAAVQSRAAALGVRILPKGLAGLVPLVLPSLSIEASAPPVSHGLRGSVSAGPGPAASPVDTAAVPALVSEPSPTKPNVLVVDDDEDIRFSWEMMREPLGIGELAAFASMEACEAAQPHYAAYDLAFVDKQIPASRWRLDQVITHLKHAGVRKVYVASGEGAEALAHDATCQAADGIVKWKIPETLPV